MSISNFNLFLDYLVDKKGVVLTKDKVYSLDKEELLSDEFSVIFDLYRSYYINNSGLYFDLFNEFKSNYNLTDSIFNLLESNLLSISKNFSRRFKFVVTDEYFDLPFKLVFNSKVRDFEIFWNPEFLFIILNFEIYLGSIDKLDDESVSKVISYYIRRCFFNYIYSRNLNSDVVLDKISGELYSYELLYYNNEYLSYYDILFGISIFYSYYFRHNVKFIEDRVSELDSVKGYSDFLYKFLYRFVIFNDESFLLISFILYEDLYDLIKSLDFYNSYKSDKVYLFEYSNSKDLNDGDICFYQSEDNFYLVYYDSESNNLYKAKSIKDNSFYELEIDSKLLFKSNFILNKNVLVKYNNKNLILYLLDGSIVYSNRFELNDFFIYKVTDEIFLKFLSGKDFSLEGSLLDYRFVNKLESKEIGFLNKESIVESKIDKVLFLLDNNIYNYVSFSKLLDLIKYSGYSNEVKYALYAYLIYLRENLKVVFYDGFSYSISDLEDVILLSNTDDGDTEGYFLDEEDLVFKDSKGNIVSLEGMKYENKDLSDLTRLEILSFVDDFLRVRERARNLSRIRFIGFNKDLEAEFEIYSLSQFKYYKMKIIFELLLDENFMLDESKSLFLKLNEALESDIRVYCSCPAYLYWGFKYINTKLDIHIEPENRKPVVRNKKIKGIVCKHLFKLLTFLTVWRQPMYKSLSSVYKSH